MQWLSAPLPEDITKSNSLLCSTPPPHCPHFSKNLDENSFPDSANLLHKTLLWPASVRCQKPPPLYHLPSSQASQPSERGPKGAHRLSRLYHLQVLPPPGSSVSGHSSWRVRPDAGSLSSLGPAIYHGKCTCLLFTLSSPGPHLLL